LKGWISKSARRQPSKLKGTWALVLGYLFFLTLPFCLARLILWLHYSDQFEGLSSADVFMGFLGGLRFDLSSMSTLLGLPILLSFLPLVRSLSWRRFWHLGIGGISLVILALLVIDLVYFAYVKRHLSYELSAAQGDWGLMVKMAWGGYKGVLLGFAGFSILWLWFWSILGRNQRPGLGLGSFVWLFLLIVALARGGFSAKPVSVIDAYAQGNDQLANLLLNGVFTGSHALLLADGPDHLYYEPKDAVRWAGGDPEAPFPMLRHNPGPKKGLNLVFFLIESLSYDYIDQLGHKNYGVTPNLDKLVQESKVYTRFYASGQRSLEGVQIVLTGLPSVIGLPTLGEGFQARYSSLGNIGQANGYQGLFVQAMKRQSFRGEAVAGATGFKHFYGSEDIPRLLDYPDPEAAPFGWDHETFQFALQKMDELEKPFVSFIVSSTTHTPFPPLPPEFEKYPRDPNAESGFLNTLAYTDWALGQFIEQAKTKPWFENTLIVLTADHAMGNFWDGDYLKRFQIPLIVYGPGIEPGMDPTLGSQIDILPSLIDWLGLQGDYAAIGRPLGEGGLGFAYMRQGPIMMLVNKQGYFRHSLANRLESIDPNGETLPEEAQAKMERQLLSIDQATFQLLLENRWAP